MKKNFLLLTIITAFFINPSFCFALDASIKTYPVQGMFLSRSVFQDTESDRKPPEFISEEFRALAKEKQRSFFVPEFIKAFNANFENAVSEITNRNKYKTLVGYLSIPRASKYIDRKPNGNEIYLPLTASLSFVNVLTGEMLYSTTNTVYEFTKQDDYNVISEKYISAYNDALKKIIDTAKENFHPFEIPVNIVDNYKDLYILDKGSEVGIAEDDLLFDMEDNQIQVIYSAQNYSVAKLLIGQKVNEKNAFIKQSNNGGINQIKKPRVLLVNDIGNNSIFDLLMTYLGKDSKINLTATNPTFNAMRRSVVDLNKDFSSTNIAPKNLPDYFLTFTFTRPVRTTFVESQHGLRSTYFQMMSCGTMFDKTGKIVFSACADDKTEPRYNNKTYETPENSIVEIMSKNLIGKIADEINAKIEFREFEYKIKKVNDSEIVIEDSYSNLSEGDKVTIFKKFKAKNGVEYLLPLFKYNVILVSKEGALCAFDYPYTDEVNNPSKSNIVKTSMIVSSGGANFYKISTDSMKLDDSDVEINDLGELIDSIIGSVFKKPLSYSFAYKKANIVNSSSMFKNKLKIQESNSNLKIEPYYSAKLMKHKAKGYSKTDSYKITAGIRVINNGNIIKEKTLSKDIVLTLPLKGEEFVLKIELLKAIYPMFMSLAGQIK